jgi:hypothetical protein
MLAGALMVGLSYGFEWVFERTVTRFPAPIPFFVVLTFVPASAPAMLPCSVPAFLETTVFRARAQKEIREM